MPSDFLLPLIDPTAPLPAYWPGGGLGAFLLFLIPIGGGIPLGVIMGTDAGVSPPMLALMYFVSDIFMAVTHEPFFWLLAWLANIFPALGKVRDFFAKASGAAGLKDEGGHGPLGLVLFSFTVDPVSARGAAAAAGHGFLAGWAFSIAGDMLYFGVLMAATLWLRDLFGDERSTIGVTLLTVWGISWFIRRRQKQARRDQTSRAGGAASRAASGPVTRPNPIARVTTVMQPALAQADGPAGDSAASPDVNVRLQPARSAPPTSAAIRKKAGRKRRSR
jgi:hypothetical protein